jgi:hypothetical protein
LEVNSLRKIATRHSGPGNDMAAASGRIRLSETVPRKYVSYRAKQLSPIKRTNTVPTIGQPIFLNRSIKPLITIRHWPGVSTSLRAGNHFGRKANWLQMCNCHVLQRGGFPPRCMCHFAGRRILQYPLRPDQAGTIGCGTLIHRAESRFTYP